jgi:NAD-dependent deacetylase
MSFDRPSLEKAANILREGNVVVLTGAGVSTESGIPDFRSAGGLWDRYDPYDYAHIASFRQNPERVWEMLAELRETLEGKKPNAAHRALATLEEVGLVRGVITQNIDGLHQAAGSKHVVEFHGNGQTLSCLECRESVSRHQVGEAHPPRCSACQAILKPDVVFFGEEIPPQAIWGSERLLEGAKTALVCGTSAEVFPASQIPTMVKQAGGTIIECNLEPALSSSVADIRLLGNAGETLPALVKALGF